VRLCEFNFPWQLRINYLLQKVRLDSEKPSELHNRAVTLHGEIYLLQTRRRRRRRIA